MESGPGTKASLSANNCQDVIIYLMRIMGIDPGIGRIGWGVIEERDGKIKALAFDCFETSSLSKEENRLKEINQEVLLLLAKFQPEAAAVEELFFSANSRTAMMVGQARGVILLSISQAGIPVFSYTPLQVKQAIVGYGRAEKKQIKNMVKVLLNLPSPPRKDDAADALAIALTHAFSYKMLNIKGKGDKDRAKNF